MKKQNLLITCSAALALSISLPAPAAPELYRGYAIIQEPTIDLDLNQVVYLQNVQGRTVLEGLLEILRGTGYRLASEEAADPEIGRLYAQPYPENQRAIGPQALHVVLERLAGPAWRLVDDPVNRLLSFEVRPAYRWAATNPTDARAVDHFQDSPWDGAQGGR